MEKLVFIGGNDLHGVPKILKYEDYSKYKLPPLPISKQIVIEQRNTQEIQVASEFLPLTLNLMRIEVKSEIGVPLKQFIELKNSNSKKYYISIDLKSKVLKKHSFLNYPKCILPLETIKIEIICNSKHPGWFKDVYSIIYDDQVLEFGVSCLYIGQTFSIDNTLLIKKAAERNAKYALDTVMVKLWNSVEYKRTVIEPFLFFVPLSLQSMVKYMKVTCKNDFFMQLEQQLHPNQVTDYITFVKTCQQNELFDNKGHLKVFNPKSLSSYESELQVSFIKIMDNFEADLIQLKKLKKKDKKLNIEDKLKVHLIQFMDIISTLDQ